jgi:hypothetical protein
MHWSVQHEEEEEEDWQAFLHLREPDFLSLVEATIEDVLKELGIVYI